MHIAIDIREVCREKRTGKGIWTSGFVRELSTRPVELTLCTDHELPKDLKRLADSKPDVHVFHPSSAGLRWHWDVATELKRNKAIDLYVSPLSYIVPCLIGKSKRVVPVVHDLIAFRNEPHDKRARFIERITLGRAVKSAFHICTVSDTTKKDLMERFPDIPEKKITSVYAAVEGTAFIQDRSGKNILCVATLCPRKNQKRLIEAYERLSDELKEKYPLVLVGGRGWDDEEIMRLAASVKGVTWKNYLSDTELEKLYAETALVTYPSLYEGFGLPILDAMTRGIPVLTSDAGSMKEVAGDSAMLVDPLRSDSIAAGIRELLTNEALRKRLSKKGTERARHFSWKKTVDLFLSATEG